MKTLRTQADAAKKELSEYKDKATRILQVQCYCGDRSVPWGIPWKIQCIECHLHFLEFCHFCRNFWKICFLWIWEKAWFLCLFQWLTHLPLDKMDASFANNIFKCIIVNEKFCILIQISLKYVPKGFNWQEVSFDSGNGLASTVASHYLNQWWPSSLMHLCGNTRERWVN